MKCFYHTDMDGKCAAAIVYKKMKNQEDDRTGFEYIPINYNQEFPFDRIKKNEKIIIVDFSLQKEGEFEKLLDITKYVIWIDHHKTAIEKHAYLEHKIKGLRKDGIAGCELTWQYFFPDMEVPRVVQLIGDYDVWGFRFGEETHYLQNGIKTHNTEPTSRLWEDWFDGIGVDSLIEEGKIVMCYRNNYYKNLIDQWAFETMFEGYTAICCNAGSVSSQLFDSVSEDYDLMIPFVFDGKQWTISLYTKKEIDCSEIAKKYGGGGHKKAAGFQCKNLPFVEMLDFHFQDKVKIISGFYKGSHGTIMAALENNNYTVEIVFEDVTKLWGPNPRIVITKLCSNELEKN